MNAQDAFDKLSLLKFDTVLDLGSGEGFHANEFKANGKTVTTVSFTPPADHVGDFLTLELPKFDCIWASHVLEHQLNVNLFLRKCFDTLHDDGILAITVPPLKHNIVGGHVSLWNAGLLLYNLILAGFDCSEASVKTYGYNISVIVRKKEAKPEGLIMDNGDIAKINQYMPFEAVCGFDGQIQEINW